MKKFIITFLLVFFVCTNARALSLISDEETEQFLQKIVQPVFNAAGILYNRDNIYIVNDESLNAFVGDGNRLFINTGTIVRSSNRDELTGVIAHESGHILGGHILRSKIKSQELNRVSIASLIMAGAAAAASGRGDVGVAIALGSQSSLMTNYAAYRVEEERSADESAVKILGQMHKSPEGLRDFMKKIQTQNMLSGIEETDYLRTHPMTYERLSFLDDAVEKSAYKENKTRDEEFLRVKAKLFAYLETPARTFKKYPASDHSVPAQYARAIANFKQVKIKEAMNGVDALIEKEPNNPYFHELKGQFLLEDGKVRAAKSEYEKALEIMPNSYLFQQNLAQAALEDNPSTAELNEVIEIMNKAVIRRPDAYSWWLLARAYGAKNDMLNSNYASAEYSYRIGANEAAQRQIAAALKLNPKPALKLKLEDLQARIDDEEM